MTDLTELASTYPTDAKRWYQQAAKAWFQEITTALDKGWTRSEIAASAGLDKPQGHRLMRAYDKEKERRRALRIARNRRLAIEFTEIATIAQKAGYEIPWPPFNFSEE